MKSIWIATCLIALCSTGRATASTAELQAVRDNTLYEDADGALSNGSGSHLFVGRTGQPARRRTALRFDVAGEIPSGAHILTAELILHVSQTASPPTSVRVHRLLEDWGEGASDAPGGEGSGTAAAPGDATWLHGFYDDTLWSTPGGTFAPAPSATTELAQPAFYSWQSRQLAADVQAMLDVPADNHGWLLIGDESTASSKRLDSRENAAAAMRPVLRLTFNAPAVAVPVVTGPWAMVLALALLASLAATAYWSTRPSSR